MKIYAPVKDFNGIRASVRFVNGIGETDDPYTARWFELHGYTVEKFVKNSEEIIEKSLENCVELDFNAMNPNELREWMRENGYGSKIKNTRNKEKLLEILRG